MWRFSRHTALLREARPDLRTTTVRIVRLRAFPPDIVERVHFIRHAQDLGFTLSEIAELLELRADDDASCAQVREAARTKIEHVRSKIERLERVLQGLQDLAEICPGDVSADRCPIFEVLEND